MNWFKRKPKAPAVHTPLDPYEAKVISAWGHTPQSWAKLPAQEKADKRTLLTKAPRYVG